MEKTINSWPSSVCLLITGLPGSAKSTLVEKLKNKWPDNTAFINADWVRKFISTDLDFSVESKLTQARRLGQLAAMAFTNSYPRICVVECWSALADSRFEFALEFSKTFEFLNRSTKSSRLPHLIHVHMDTIDWTQSKYPIQEHEYERPSDLEVDFRISTFPTSKLADSFFTSLKARINELDRKITNSK